MSLYPRAAESALANIPRTKGSKVFVLDSVLGNDGNSGTKWDAPLKTIDAAYAKLTDGSNDALLIVGNGTSYATTAALTWQKDFTHVIGLSAPELMEPRTRIKSPAALATTPFITWDAVGCIVKNMSFWHETSNAAGLVCFHISGGRNYFENCQFAGAIGANAITGARSLKISGSASYAGGNTFKNCIIGNDTIAAPDGAGGLEFVLGAMHNKFDDCIFNVETAGTTYSHVVATLATATGRLNLFRRCLFINEGSGAMASVVTVGAALSAAHYIFMQDCWMYGAAKWDAANTTGVNTGNKMIITSA